MFKTIFKKISENRPKAVFLLLIAASLVVLGVNKYKNSASTTPQFQTGTAERGTLVGTVSASGSITAGGSVDITTSATGIVNLVYVKNGDTVTAGQKIAEVTLDQNSQQRQAGAWASYLSSSNQLNSAQAKINSLQSSLFKANQAFVNDKGVANPIVDDPKYIIERADWLQSEADYKNQQQVISQAQSSVSSSWLSYQQAAPTITAPTTGIISNLTIAPGVAITSSTNSNTTISSQKLGNVTVPGSHIQSTVNLSEIDATKVKPDQKVTLMLDAFTDKTFAGKVLIVNTNGQVSSGVTTYPAIISFDDNPSNIYPNMAATAKIITSVKDNAILVPTSSVQTSNGSSTVRILKNGQVTSVNVEVGDSNDTQTEIISGTNEGDIVVTGAISSTTGSQNGNASPFSALGGRGFGGFGGGGVRRVGGGG